MHNFFGWLKGRIIRTAGTLIKVDTNPTLIKVDTSPEQKV